MFVLDHSPGFLINKAALAMRRALEHRLHAYGLTAPQWAVLARLWEADGMTPGAVGESLFFDKPTITGIINRLQKKGLVKKTRDLDDRRCVRVLLTSKGRALEAKLPPLASEVNAAALVGMSGQEVALLKKVLERIWKNLEG